VAASAVARGRSVSFSVGTSGAPPPASSPPRWRDHASEAGSPTLEQVCACTHLV
jgi:hypothetical protein